MNSLTTLSALTQVVNHDICPQMKRLSQENITQKKIIKKWKKARFMMLKNIYARQYGECNITKLILAGFITVKQYANIEYKRIRDTNELNELFGRLGYTRPALCSNRSEQHEIAVCRRHLATSSPERKKRMTFLAKNLNMSIVELINWAHMNDPEWNTGQGENNDNSKEAIYQQKKRNFDFLNRIEREREEEGGGWSWDRNNV